MHRYITRCGQPQARFSHTKVGNTISHFVPKKTTHNIRIIRKTFAPENHNNMEILCGEISLCHLRLVWFVRTRRWDWIGMEGVVGIGCCVLVFPYILSCAKRKSPLACRERRRERERERDPFFQPVAKFGFGDGISERSSSGFFLGWFVCNKAGPNSGTAHTHKHTDSCLCICYHRTTPISVALCVKMLL